MISDFFAYDFLQRALLAGVMVAIVAPLLGIFLTVRRYALIADTLSHAALAGVALGIFLGINPIVAALVVAVAVAVGIERLRFSGHLSGETVLALFLSGSLAFAVVLFSAVKKFNAGVLSYLFGSIMTVTSEDLWLMGGLSIGIVVIIGLFYRPFFLLAFDEDIARANGIPVKSYGVLLSILTAAMVAVSMRVVGILLIGALMVIPVLSATQYNRSFRVTIMIAVVISVLSMVLGLGVSSFWNLAPGGTIVLCAIGFFMASVGYRKTIGA